MSDWTPEAVQEGLIQAWDIMRRMPSGDRRSNGVSSIWSQAVRGWSNYSQDSADVRLILGVRSAEVDMMEEAWRWLEYLVPDDRRLIGAVLPILSKGYSRVPWGRVKRRIGSGDRPAALKVRFERAMRVIAAVLNVGMIR